MLRRVAFHRPFEQVNILLAFRLGVALGMGKFLRRIEFGLHLPNVKKCSIKWFAIVCGKDYDIQ